MLSVSSFITENQTAIIILMSALPLLLAGLVEDTTKYGSVQKCLLIALFVLPLQARGLG